MEAQRQEGLCRIVSPGRRPVYHTSVEEIKYFGKDTVGKMYILWKVEIDCGNVEPNDRTDLHSNKAV